jgi:hypothetical protein
MVITILLSLFTSVEKGEKCKFIVCVSSDESWGTKKNFAKHSRDDAKK